MWGQIRSGVQSHGRCEARAGAKSVVPPRITLFISIIKNVSQDKKASEALVTACRKLLETLELVPKVVSVFKKSKTFDKTKTRLEAAVFPSSLLFLSECVDL
ncbi:unnamed protein product [Polarella glacialis]|uniref:Uncharacterized protein n=1 Tax=Polarella glacialis TaxID=89957 RepID=A0A813DFA3_POLGL|nr:unnamed protein product [Polarella glacialis]CAE8594877.1 unnamed protein product [Polarella glacialis]